MKQLELFPREMHEYLNCKVKFIADYMEPGEYDEEKLCSIVNDGCEFDEPYFINEDGGRFFTLEYVKDHLIQ